MPQIKADREVRHGWHTDYFWPGLIWSVWEFKRISLRHEHTYGNANHTRLIASSWQIQINVSPEIRFGFRIERDLQAD